MSALRIVQRGIAVLFVILLVVYAIYFTIHNHSKVPVTFLDIGETHVAVEWYLVGLLSGTALLFGAVGFVVGFVPSFMAKGRVQRQARKDRVAFRKLDRGMDQLERKDYAAAKSRLAKAIKRAPTEIQGHVALAEVHLGEGDVERALDVIDEGLRHLPGNVRLILERARILDEAGRLPEAIAELRRCLDRSGPNVGVLERLRDLSERTADWETASGAQAELVRLLQSQGRAGAKDASLHLADLSFEWARSTLRDGDAAAAVDRLRKLIRKFPDYLPAHVTLGDALVESGERGEAIKAWEKAFRKARHLALVERLENACLAEGEPDRALKIHEDAVKAAPDDLALRFAHGKFALRIDKVDEALAAFGALEEAGVRFRELSVLKGEALHRKQSFDEATAEFRKAAEADDARYACRSCGEDAEDWQPRCESCQAWGTLVSAVRRRLETARPEPASASLRKAV